MKPVWSGDSRLGNHRFFLGCIVKVAGVCLRLGSLLQNTSFHSPFFPRQSELLVTRVTWVTKKQLGRTLSMKYWLLKALFNRDHYKSPHHWVGFHPQKKAPMIFWESGPERNYPTPPEFLVLICWKTHINGKEVWKKFSFRAKSLVIT